MFRAFFVTASILTMPVFMFSQINERALNEAYKKLGIKQSPEEFSSLFIHADKTAYPVTEDLRFSAYVIDKGKYELHNTLYTLLVNDMTRELVRIDRFAIDSAFSAGSIDIPDSLQSGEYSLICYTNRFLEGTTSSFFRQPIQILGQKTPFTVTFMPHSSKDSASVSVKVTNQGGETKGIVFTYSVYEKGHTSQRHSVILDQSGEVRIPLPNTYQGDFLELVGTLQKEGKKMGIKRTIPTRHQTMVRYFVANNKLVTETINQVGYEIKDTAGNSVSLKGSLLEDSVSIRDIESDQYGWGNFRFSPQAGKQYATQFSQNDLLPSPLTDVAKDAYSIQPASGVIMDTLVINLSIPDKDDECMVIVHNGRDVFYSVLIKLPGRNGRLKIPCDQWPPGLCTVSLVSGNGMVKDGRMILIKERDPIVATIKTDSATYHTNSRVVLHISVKDQKGNPVKGVFSFSCSAIKMVKKNTTDITRYINFDRFLRDPQALPPTEYLDSRMKIENVLLQHADRFLTADLLLSDKPAYSPYQGRVYEEGKKVKSPVRLMVLPEKTKNITTISTDTAGRFMVPPESIRGFPGTYAYVYVVSKTPTIFKIVIDTPGKMINDWLIHQYFSINRLAPDEFTAAEKEHFAQLAGNILPDVVVKAKSSSSRIEPYYGKEGDYVCIKGFLNCPVHGGARKPVDGELLGTVKGGERVIEYHAPKGIGQNVNLINTTAYSDPSPENKMPALPVRDSVSQDNNTLSWLSRITTDSNGEAVISFYTNQLIGSFVCRMEGISAQKTFSGKTTFTVVKKD